MPGIDDLRTDNDATYADNGGDPSVQLHQMYHDVIHALLRTVGAVRIVTDSPYTAVLTDGGKVLELNWSANGNFVIPAHSTVAWPRNTWIRLGQRGTGIITVTHASGSAALHSRGNIFRSAGQYAELEVRCSNTDDWWVSGDLQA